MVGNKIAGIKHTNKEVHSISKTVEERLMPVNSQDLVRRNYTEIWCTYPRDSPGIPWSGIRDNNHRSFPFPKDLYIPGKADKRGNLRFWCTGDTIYQLPQWTPCSALGFLQEYNVTAISGNYGSVANRAAFYSTEVGIAIPNDIGPLPFDDYEIIFTNGDMTGMRRRIHIYRSSDGFIQITHPNGMYRDNLPGWQGRGVQVGDKFKIQPRITGTETDLGESCNWELTSRVYKGDFEHSLNIYKSVRFKYISTSGMTQKHIGDDSRHLYHLMDGTPIKMQWKEIHYHWQPWIQKIMPSDVFTNAGISRHKGFWPAQAGSPQIGGAASMGAITNVTMVTLGTYMVPGTSTLVPVYVWDVTYTNGGTKRYEYPFLFTIGNLPPGFDVEMWTYTKRHKLMPRQYACRKRGGQAAYTQHGDYIYLNQDELIKLASATSRSNPTYNYPVWMRARNQKNGGFTPLTNEHIFIKVQRQDGYWFSLPKLLM